MQIVRSCALVLGLGLTLVRPDQAGDGDSAANGAHGCAVTAGRGGCELRRPAQPNDRAPRVARLAQPPAPPAPLQPRLGPMGDEYGRAYSKSDREERMAKRKDMDGNGSAPVTQRSRTEQPEPAKAAAPGDVAALLPAAPLPSSADPAGAAAAAHGAEPGVRGSEGTKAPAPSSAPSPATQPGRPTSFSGSTTRTRKTCRESGTECSWRATSPRAAGVMAGPW